jgi:hypothetical protein
MDSFFSGEVTQLFSDIYCGVELCKIPFNVATVRFVIHFIMILLSGLYVLPQPTQEPQLLLRTLKILLN